MKHKKRIVLGVVIILFIISFIMVWFVLSKKETVTYQDIKKLYASIASDSCTSFPVVHNQTIDQMSDETILFLIFNQMKQDRVLTNQMTREDYLKSAKKIVSENNIPKTFSSFSFDGYEYQMNEDTITRKKVSCSLRQYVSKLYGYSSNDNQVEIDVRVGYIESENLYTLDGKLIGKVEDHTLNTLLDEATLQTYTYVMEQNQYSLYRLETKE